MKIFKGLIIPIVIIMLYSLNLYGQEDVTKLRSIINLKSSQEKIDSLKYFKNTYPESQYLYKANQELFTVYADMGNADSALYYADAFINFLPPQNRASALNSAAYILAEKNIGLDSALSYIEQALILVQGNARYSGMVNDTKAYILYKKGDSKSALEVQKGIMEGNEDNPEFLFHMALYQHAAGNNEEALKYAALSSLYGGLESTAKFNEWKAAGTNYDKLVMPLINKFIEDSETDNHLLAKSGAAAFMAQAGINLKLAEAWVDSALKSINKKTGYEEFVSIKKNYGIVKSSVKKYKDALSSLLDITDLADPWMSDYWLALGNSYVNLNEKEKALNAFASCLAVYEDTSVINAALKITSKEQLDKIIEKKKEELSSPETGKYTPDGKSKGRVILAELFTGAECPPCVAADMAFDELSEFYPRNVLAILEFHLHIPGPDPITNPDTFKRYQYYGADYGTPTVFFNGGEKITGGGPAIAAKNRYNVYNYSIKKFINDKPAADISGTAKPENGTIKIDLTVKPSAGLKGKAELHIAVAEKSINYTGANGINKHIFAVRDLVDGQNGIEVSLAKKSDITKTVIIDSLKNTIKTYLTNPKTDPSWRLQDFSGWRNDTEILSAINEKNLAVVAWLQDSKTKEVLQAYYMDVK